MNKITDITTKLLAIAVIAIAIAFLFIIIILRSENLVEANGNAVFETVNAFDSACIISSNDYQKPICRNAFTKIKNNKFRFEFTYKFCENPFFNIHNPVNGLFGDSIRIVLYKNGKSVGMKKVSYEIMQKENADFGNIQN